MSDAAQVQADLERAAGARRERTSLTERQAAARAYLAAVEQRVTERRAALDTETAEVARLESFSPTRILASLRGTRASALDRESAERDAARYAVAEAEARRDSARRDCDSLDAQISALGDVDAMHVRALEAKEVWVANNDPAVAGPLADIAERRGVLLARDGETREAHEAGVRAHQCLSAAHQHLAGAESWSTWDAFGGGLLTDLAKHQKVDQATQMLHQADLALGTFSRELADVDLPPVAGVQIGTIGRTFDVFFDNLFSDLAVRQRIQQAAGQVAHTLHIVEQALQCLQDSGRSMAAELEELEARRTQILLRGPGTS